MRNAAQAAEPGSAAESVRATDRVAADMSANRPIAVCGVSAGYAGRDVLKDVDLTIQPGRITTIIGPNGCGKSTLLRTIGRLLPIKTGEVRLFDEPITRMRSRQIATTLSILPQAPVAPEGLTAADLTARGRAPHQPWYRQWSDADEQIAAEAMRATGVLDLADRPLDELSGGQRQRAWIAMTLAQQTPVLLLDEPTTYLDLAHAVGVLDLIVALRSTAQKTIVMVLHDLGLAARYSDHIVVMKDGTIQAEGSPIDVLTPELLLEVFGLSAHVFADPVDGLPTVVPTTHA